MRRMQWAKLEYTRSQVDAAGRLLASGGGTPRQVDDALDVLNNWRAAHGFPLNTLQIGLRQRARKVYEHALVAQRLKRVPSIVSKLQRFTTMNLSRMQDIGGCRAVVDTAPQVRRLRAIYAKSKQQHEFVSEKDYIADPKASGYRGIHLIYRFTSQWTPEHKGRMIEIQLRSRLQHAWATAVETAGTFLQQSLKSSQGSERWLEFFSLTSSAFAIMERAPLVPGTPTAESDLRSQIVEMASDLEVKRTLGAYAQALKIAEETSKKNAFYFLLSLIPAQGSLTVFSYKRDQLELATSHYLEIEKTQAETSGSQSVLVAVDSLSALRRSYPNYFLDTQVFMASLDRFISST